MNRIVALPVAAALPVAMPPMAMPAEASEGEDAELLKLVDEYIAAEQRWADLTSALDRLDRHGPPPEKLRIQPRDLELGRKLTFDSTDEFWQRPCDITQWRNLEDHRSERVQEAEGCVVLRIWTIKPSEELRERGAEIVQAFDAWNKKRPRGYRKLKREVDRANKVYSRLEERVATTPATTIEGMQAKLRCALAWQGKFRGNQGSEIDCFAGGCPEAMARSIMWDLEHFPQNA